MSKTVFIALLLLSGCSPGRDEEADAAIAFNDALMEQGYKEYKQRQDARAKSPVIAPVKPPAEGKQGSATVSEATGVPDYDTKGYCRTVGDAAGGSSTIEEACRDQEFDARLKLGESVVPTRMFNYCDSIGAAIGGSYKIMNACIEREKESAKRL